MFLVFEGIYFLSILKASWIKINLYKVTTALPQCFIHAWLFLSGGTAWVYGGNFLNWGLFLSGDFSLCPGDLKTRQDRGVGDGKKPCTHLEGNTVALDKGIQDKEGDCS